MSSNPQSPATSVLRIVTAGSVDDGKSTLIGRLLYESHALLDDQLAALEQQKRQGEALDLSLVTDGLKSEREQGITIDVAYKYFASHQRKYILADAPGHVQYTRNMVTAASRADVALILVDASHGLLEQTRRHSYLIHLLGVAHVILLVNKIDRIAYEEERIHAIDQAFRNLAWNQMASSLTTIPISALRGDNLKMRSPHTPWYQGPTLLEALDGLSPRAEVSASFRLPLQYIGRHPDGRRFATGTLQRGRVRVGDRIQILPSQQKSAISELWVHGQRGEEASAGQALAIVLADERDLERGQLLVPDSHQRQTLQHFQADLVWFDEEPWRQGERYILRTGTQTARAEVHQIFHRFDLESLQPEPSAGLGLNDIARIALHSSQRLDALPFAEDQGAGTFVLIDPRSFRTVAAGLIGPSLPLPATHLHRGKVVWVREEEPEDDKSLHIPLELLHLNAFSSQVQLAINLLEEGWTLRLDRQGPSERLRQELTRSGWDDFEDALVGSAD